MQLIPGTTLHHGRYLLNHSLGSQGFGVPYRGTDTHTKQAIVLKTLHPALHHSQALRRLRDRFLALSHCLSRCHHPSVVPVLEIFQEEGLPFLVMPYISGPSLAELVGSGQHLPEAEVLRCIRQIGAALAHGHCHGLVHGNLKPENILLADDTQLPVLIGYGFSAERILAKVQSAVPGFPHTFTAPEQIGETGDRLASADLYALAANFYLLLTHQPPVAVTDAPTADPAERLPLLPLLRPSLQQAITQALVLDPQARPAGIGAWLRSFPPEKTSTPDLPQPSTALQLEVNSDAEQPSEPLAPTNNPPVVVCESRPSPESRPAVMLPPVSATATPTAVTVLELESEQPPYSPSPEITLPTRIETSEEPSLSPLTTSSNEITASGAAAFSLELPPVPLPATEPPPQFRMTPLPESVPVPDADLPPFRSEPVPVSPLPVVAPLASSSAPSSQSALPGRSVLSVGGSSWHRLLSWLPSLALAGGIAAAVGLSFGLAVRFSATTTSSANSGGGLLRVNQSFPELPWKGTLSPANLADAPIETLPIADFNHPQRNIKLSETEVKQRALEQPEFSMEAPKPLVRSLIPDPPRESLPVPSSDETHLKSPVEPAPAPVEPQPAADPIPEAPVPPAVPTAPEAPPPEAAPPEPIAPAPAPPPAASDSNSTSIPTNPGQP
jgi:serine/threonine-protein kinase